MKKLRFLFASVLLWLMAAGAWAQTDAAQRLVVWMKGGEKVYFDLAKEPETTFENGMLVIKCDGEAAAYYHLANVLRYTYEGTMTAIGSPSLRPGEIVFRQGADQMQFEGLADGTQLDIYSLDGKKLASQTARSGQATTVSLVGHPAGTYIVKVGSATYKFMKR